MSQSATDNSRCYIQWLDYAKIFGIFLMVWGHAAHSSAVNVYIYSFHMPLFFIISGMLYKPMSLKQTLKRDWHSLWIPYLLLNLICWVYFVAKQIIKGATVSLSSLCQNACAILLGVGYDTDLFLPVCIPGWFIYTLALIRIILAVVYRGQKRNLWLLSVFSIAATMFLQSRNIDLYVPFDSAFLVMPYICIGIIFRNYITKVVEWDGRFNWVPFAVIFVLWFLLATYNGRVDADRCLSGNSLALYYIVSILGTLSLFKCSMVVCNYLTPSALRGGVSYLSKCTLVYVGLNVIALELSRRAIRIVFHIETFSDIMDFTTSAVAFILLIPVCIWCREKFPIILGNRR